MAAEPQLRPPYAAFRTFWRFIENLSEQGSLPQHLEKPAFGGMSGSARSQVMVGLRFFGLVDEDQRPTPKLRELVAGPTADKLRALLETHYPEAIALGLDTATVRQLDGVLRDMGAGQGETLRRSRIFFIHAANEAGLEVGPYLQAGPAPPTVPKPRRTRASRANGKSASTASAPDPATRPGFTSDLHPFIQGLLQELPPPGSPFPEERQQSWIDLAKATFKLLYAAEDKD